VETLQFGALQADGLAHGGEPLDLLDELAGDIGKRLGNLEAQAGDPLDHAFHGDAGDGLPDLVRAQAGGLLGFGIGGLAGGFGLLANLCEFFLDFGFGALRAYGRFGWFSHVRVRSA
jgi:hypothetical protein